MVWEDEDNTPTCPGVLTISFDKTAARIKRVIVDTQIDGYEEIDAVELIGENSLGVEVEQGNPG
jgi:hypothetical protein